MKCVIQRVRRASVTVGDELVSEIGTGLLVLAAVEKGDREQTMSDAAKKIRELRIFSDEAGRMNRDVAEAGGAILAVSQFTLAGSLERGRRPSFDNAEERCEWDIRVTYEDGDTGAWGGINLCETVTVELS